MLKWCGHAMRKDEEYEGKTVMRMDVLGKRKKDRREGRWAV